MKKLLYLLSVVALCFAACEKNEVIEPMPDETTTEDTGVDDPEPPEDPEADEPEPEEPELTGDDIITFKDPCFLEVLIALHFDKNSDGQISVNEAKAVKQLVIDPFYYPMISDMSELKYFTSLTKLQCDYNKLTSLDVSKNTALTYLSCEHNGLTSLDVSNNTALTNLQCEYNKLTSLDISNNPGITIFKCAENPGNGSVFSVTVWDGFDINNIPNGFTTEEWKDTFNSTISVSYVKNPTN